LQLLLLTLTVIVITNTSALLACSSTSYQCYC